MEHVNYENTIVGNLNQKYAYNLGYDGFGPLLEVTPLIEMDYLKDRKCFFFIEENDLQGLKKEMEYTTLQKYLKMKIFHKI